MSEALLKKQSSRKPTPPSKEPAQVLLNNFLKEHGILIGTRRSTIDHTNNGGIVISPPTIVAVYASERDNMTN